MRVPLRLALLSLLAMPGLACAQTAAAGAGPYVSLGLGPSFLQNQYFHPAPAPSGGTTYRFDIGPAGYVSLGYGFAGGLRLELEGDYLNAHVRGAAGPAPLQAGGYEQQFGGFVNAFQDFAPPFSLPLTPFLGVGAGYQEMQLNGVSATPSGGTPADNGPTQGQGSFAYQGIAGVSAPLGMPGLDLTAEYRMVGMVTPPAFSRASDDLPAQTTVHNSFSHELLIGLRLLFGAPEAAPPPPAAPAPVAVPAPAAARTYLVFFDWDKADLTDRARAIIAEAAKASDRVQLTRIEVDGYTDLSGTPHYNQALSTRRADAVAEELVRDGVSRSEITVQGYGETNPLVPTAQGVREPQNRRVEIILK